MVAAAEGVEGSTYAQLRNIHRRSEFPPESGGEGREAGVLCNKRVVAETEEEAIKQAFDSLQKDPRLAPAYAKSRQVEPTLSAEVVHELDHDNEMKDSGYTFYPMDEQ